MSMEYLKRGFRRLAEEARQQQERLDNPRAVYPIHGLKGRMDLAWTPTRTGKIAVFAPTSWEGEWLWMYCNPKTGWVPLSGRRAHQ